jgi:thiol-disulfide isomerase/thioredoxin
LDGVVFDEVEIDWGGNYTSTPVRGGETWCVNDFRFDQELVDPNEAFCAREDITCIGETVEDFSLLSCDSGEMVSMASLADGNQALWFVLTAGWCPACSSYMPSAISFANENESRGLELVVVLGETDARGRPSVDYCRSYAARFDGSPARFYIDHDGSYSYATTFLHLWPYLDATGALGLPWNGVIDAQNMVYAHGDGAHTNLNTVLGGLL